MSLHPALILLLLSASVEEELERATAALEAFEFETALQALSAVEAAPEKSCGQHRRLFELRGIALATLGQDRAAEDAFAKLVAMNPNAALRYTLSPKVTFRFEAGRERLRDLGEVRLELNAPFAHPTNAPLDIDVRLTHDPVGETDSGRFSFQIEDAPWHAQRFRFDDAGRARITIPPSGRDIDLAFRYYVEAHDAQNNCLYQLGTAEQPRVLQLVHRYSPPSWPVWTGAATTVAFLAAGGAFGLGARRADGVLEEELSLPPAQQDPQRRTDADADLERFGNAANVAFIGAGVSAVVTGILYLILFSDDSP